MFPTIPYSIPYVSEVIQDRCTKHHQKFEVHQNPLIDLLLQPVPYRRLKRSWSLDLSEN